MQAAAAPAAAAPPPPETAVCTEAELTAKRGRLLAQVHGRYVAVIVHGGALHAIDATCYHMGGPLLHADIEDCSDFGPCVVCPWHRYEISLRTGDSLYKNLKGQQCSKGVKQRVHEVYVRDGQVYVRLAAAAGVPPAGGGAKVEVESDTYAFKAPPPAGANAQAPPGRSGDVLRLAGRGRGRGGGPAPGAAGVRRPGGACAPPGAGVMGDVARSMSGADGRAPWARCAPPPRPPPPPGTASFSAMRAPPPPGAAAAAGAGAGAAASSAPPLGVSDEAGTSAAADADGWVRCEVLASAAAGRDSVRLTVAGALPGHRAGPSSPWTRGSHLMVRLGAGLPERPYTPYLRNPAADADGAAPRFELLVKAYAAGALSPALAALPPRGALYVRGPVGGVGAVLPGARALGFVAGGTGLTPMLQVILPLLQGPAPPPALRLLCFNKEAADVLLRDELEQLSAACPQLVVTHFLSSPTAEPPAGWRGGRGRPSRANLEAHLPPPAADVQVFWCGPPPFNECVRAHLGEIGFTEGHEFS